MIRIRQANVPKVRDTPEKVWLMALFLRICATWYVTGPNAQNHPILGCFDVYVLPAGNVSGCQRLLFSGSDALAPSKRDSPRLAGYV